MGEPDEKVDQIFAAALEISDPGERSAYLQQACGDDQALRREVESLFGAHQRAGTFLEEPAPGAPFGVPPPGTRASPPAADLRAKGGAADEAVRAPFEQPGDRVGRYKLLERIGEGGFGTVWMAEQEEPVRRCVALKIIKLGMDTRQVVARFEAERQALALMDHANIARVFDGGATETGRPYFVMELVRGIKITEYSDQNQLSIPERLELFILVCQAVQHAHQKGVIHRDLKPSNILVTLHDDVPVPKVIDFGIAKATEQPLTDKTLITGFHQLIGTPCYMSPEQAELTSVDIDTRSDIYSLGVLLYELLTGKTPFDAETLRHIGLEAIRRVIREQDPVRPSTRLTELVAADVRRLSTKSKNPKSEMDRASLRRLLQQRKELISLVSGDLDWIVMKCLEKDRNRRYATANGMAADLRRHLNNEPVVARPPSRLYQFQKSVQRNRVLFAAGAAVTLALLTGLGVSLWLLSREREAHRQAHVAEAKAEENLWQAYWSEARAIRVSGRAGSRFESLDALAKAAAIRSSPELRNEAIAAMALADIRVARRLPGTPDSTPAAALNRQFSLYARVDRAGNIFVRRLLDDSEVAALPGFGNRGVFLRFSADGRFLAAKYDPSETSTTRASVLLVWDLNRREAVLRLTNVIADVALDFHPQQPLVAVGHSGALVCFYTLPAAVLTNRITLEVRPLLLRFSPQGDLLAASSKSATSIVVLLDWAQGRVIHKLRHEQSAYGVHEGGTFGIGWHPEGHLLASGSADRRIYLWEARQGQLRGVLHGHTAAPVRLAFHPTGDLLASAGWDATICLWDAVRQESLLRIPGKSACLDFDASGDSLGFMAEGNTLSLLEVAGQPACRTLVTDSRIEYHDAAFSPDGRVLALAASDGVVLWDIARRRATNLVRLQWPRSVQFTQDGRDLIASAGGLLQRWPIVSLGGAQAALRFGPPKGYEVHKGAETACLIPGSRRVAAAGSGTATVLDLDRPTERTVLSGHVNATSVSACPDGRWIATGSSPLGGAVVWDARTGQRSRSLPVEGNALVRFSPEGQWLAVGAQSEYALFAVGSWELRRRVAGDPSVNYHPMTFSPDARVLAIRKSAQAVALVNPADGRELALLPAEQARPLCFSPDGTLLVVTERVRAVRVWDLRLVREELAKLNLDWNLPPYPPAPNTPPPKPLRIEVVTQ